MENAKEKLYALAERKNVKIIDFKLYSNHPDDDYLYLVLCESKTQIKFITWVANISKGCEGFSTGHYFEACYDGESIASVLKGAVDDFLKRGYETHYKEKETSDDIIYKTVQCIDIDIQNLKDNDFDSVEEVLDFYRNMDIDKLLKIYFEYYGENN